MDLLIIEEIHKQLENLSVDQQHRVLVFVRSLASKRPAGVPGRDLIRFAGTIDRDDLALMAQAIEEGCESVDAHEW